MNDRVGKKQIVFDVPMELHKEIKKRSNEQYQTLKGWISQAIAEKIEREKGLGWK
jgi:hypothetical protein